MAATYDQGDGTSFFLVHTHRDVGLPDFVYLTSDSLP